MSTKISDLPVAASVALSDIAPVVIVSGPTTKRATFTVIRTALMPVALASEVSGTLPAANGGTGITALGTGVATFLGTPSGANLASALTTALPDTKGGTGLTALGTGVATWLGTPSSANLAAAVTGETGSGALMFGTSPTIKTDFTVRNPGDTFGYVITPAAIAADRTLTLPLLAGNDTLVTEAFAQTLTNKTIAGASNTLSVRIANDVTGLGTGVATFLATPSGANLASALTTALPDTKGGTGLTALGTGVATWLGTPSGANLASALTTALPDTKGGTGLTSLGTGVATWLGTPSGANLASALTTALPETKGGTGLTALGSGVATALGTFSSANIKTACTDETGSGGALVFATSPTIDAPTLSGLPVLSGNSASTSNNAKGTAVDVNPVNVQTTDATVTTLDSFTIASNSAVVVSWLVTAIKSDSSQAAAYSVTACFRNAAGTAAQVGTSTTTIIGESDSVWDATIDNSTTTIRLRITGKAATTIQWTSILTRLTVIP